MKKKYYMLSKNAMPCLKNSSDGNYYVTPFGKLKQRFSFKLCNENRKRMISVKQMLPKFRSIFNYLVL